MRRIPTLVTAITVGATLVPVATAATDPSLPPAGSYTLGGKTGFKVNKQRTAVTGLRFSFTVGPTSDVDCTSSTLPTGAVVASIAAPLKLTAAHRGGSTTYIVGRSTPKTSNGITPIAKTFRLSTGGTAKGTMYLAFRSDRPTFGDGVLTVADCTVSAFFHKR